MSFSVVGFLLQQSSDSGCVIVPFVIIGVVIAIIVSNSNSRQRAWRIYQEALHRLKSDPSNPNLREEALRAGRYFSNMSRNWRGVTLFDEVALMNDINAACAAASAPRFVAQPIPTPRQPVEARLQRLLELKSQGMIDEQEYAERRREILKEI